MQVNASPKEFQHPGMTVKLNTALGPGVYDLSTSSWKYKFASESGDANPAWTSEDEDKVLPEVHKIVGATSTELEEFVKSAFDTEIRSLGSHEVAIAVSIHMVVGFDVVSDPKTITLESNVGGVATLTTHDITHNDFSQLYTNFSTGDPIFSFTVSSLDANFPSAANGFFGIDGGTSLTRLVCKDTDKTQFPTLWKYPYYAIYS